MLYQFPATCLINRGPPVRARGLSKSVAWLRFNRDHDLYQCISADLHFDVALN